MNEQLYVGVFDGLRWSVYIQELDGGVRVLKHPLTGCFNRFAWGDGGRGPAELAYALLADGLEESQPPELVAEGRTRAWRLHQEFKEQIVSPWPMGEGWRMTRQQIKQWAQDHAVCVDCGAKSDIGDKERCLTCQVAQIYFPESVRR
jgi:hypothetical protein